MKQSIFKPRICECCCFYYLTGCQIDHFMPFFYSLVNICEIYEEMEDKNEEKNYTENAYRKIRSLNDGIC